MSRGRQAFWGGLIGGALGPTVARLTRKVGGLAVKALAFACLAFYGYLYNLTGGSAKGAPVLLVLIVLCVVALVVLLRSNRQPHLPRLHGSERIEREPIPDWLRAEIIARDDSMCGICGFRVTNPREIHIDHVHPVHAGGTNHPDNLQVAHDDCNLRKGGVVGWVPPYRRTT